jgi:polysaccharide export outer membrane protein
MRVQHILIQLALLLLIIAGCGAGSIDPAYQALVEQESSLPVAGEMGVGDRFQLSVHGQGELSGEFSVSNEGDINYPYLGRLTVLGKTCSQIEEMITKGLGDGYIQNPSVRCSITEFNSKRIYIFGAVGSPGSYPYRSNLSIIEGIALAGGFAERASSNGTKLSRVINGTEIQVRVPLQDIVEGKSRNIRLLPSDIIFVPETAY